MQTTVELPIGSKTFDDFRNRNETELTYNLKWAAWKWLWEVVGCRVIGFEVRLEGPFGRIADVVGLGPENRVFLVEVKSSRADLRRDDNNDRTREKLVTKSRSLDRAVELTERVLSNAAKSAADRKDPVEGSAERFAGLMARWPRRIAGGTGIGTALLNSVKQLEYNSCLICQTAHYGQIDLHELREAHRFQRLYTFGESFTGFRTARYLT